MTASAGRSEYVPANGADGWRTETAEAAFRVIDSVKQYLEIPEMMDWIPIAFVTFKVLMFGTGMFFAIKWHYDQDKENRRAVLRKGGLVLDVLALLFLVVGLITFVLIRSFGLDLSMP